MKEEYCYITKKDNGIYIDSYYNAEFVETLKRHVPKEHRTWFSDTKQWWVSDKFIKQAKLDAKAFYENIIEC